MGRLFQPDVGSGFLLAVTTASASSTANQFNGNQSSFYIFNEGPNAACVRWTRGSSTAIVTDLCIPAGSCQTFGKEGSDTISAICSTGTATLHISPGEGE